MLLYVQGHSECERPNECGRESEALAYDFPHMIFIQLLRFGDLWYTMMQITISVLTTATIKSGMTTAIAISTLLVSVVSLVSDIHVVIN